MPESPRVILHVDMDAFYVSVELLRRPELIGLPVVVGGTGARGVVAAASYEARKYGVFSAMPSARAKKLCPQAVFLAGDHALYQQVSKRLLTIYRSYSPLVEPLALDEAFIDVSGAERLHGNGHQIAIKIRERIFAEEGLQASVGVASSKFVAKLASVSAKPRVNHHQVTPGLGVKVLAPSEELGFVQALPVERLWGVGPATLAKLRVLHITTVGDLAAVPLVRLTAAVGRGVAEQLNRLAHAIDDREVVPDVPAKSVSHEETFATDIHDFDELRREVLRQSDAVARRLRKSDLVGRTVQLKLRYGDFETLTRSQTIKEGTNSAREIAQVAQQLLRRIHPERGVRLLGVGVSNLLSAKAPMNSQLSFFDDSFALNPPILATGQPNLADTDQVLDAIRDRFGEDAIGSAATITDEGLRPIRRGSQQWGPNEK